VRAAVRVCMHPAAVTVLLDKSGGPVHVVRVPPRVTGLGPRRAD